MDERKHLKQQITNSRSERVKRNLKGKYSEKDREVKRSMRGRQEEVDRRPDD